MCQKRYTNDNGINKVRLASDKSRANENRNDNLNVNNNPKIPKVSTLKKEKETDLSNNHFALLIEMEDGECVDVLSPNNRSGNLDVTIETLIQVALPDNAQTFKEKCYEPFSPDYVLSHLIAYENPINHRDKPFESSTHSESKNITL